VPSETEARALGLAHPRFREAGWTVAVEGREPVAAGVGLPVVLAFLTLASGAVPPEPLVAVGDVSLHGDLVAPEDLAERLQHLPELAAGGILVLPEPVPEGPRSGWTLISAPTLALLLAALRR
jgi:predicted ATP-dependent serine protease